jgi:hypothetical protein
VAVPVDDKVAGAEVATPDAELDTAVGPVLGLPLGAIFELADAAAAINCARVCPDYILVP